MTDTELGEKLRERGHDVGRMAMGDDGKFRYSIDGVPMLRADAVDLANGTATLDEIVKRDSAKRLGA